MLPPATRIRANGMAEALKYSHVQARESSMSRIATEASSKSWSRSDQCWSLKVVLTVPEVVLTVLTVPDDQDRYRVFHSKASKLLTFVVRKQRVVSLWIRRFEYKRHDHSELRFWDEVTRDSRKERNRVKEFEVETVKNRIRNMCETEACSDETNRVYERGDQTSSSESSGL